jgi:hypothetical protein
MACWPRVADGLSIQTQAVPSFYRPSIFNIQGPVDRGRLPKHPNMRYTRNILGEFQVLWKYRDGILHGVVQNMGFDSATLEADGGREDQFGEKLLL